MKKRVDPLETYRKKRNAEATPEPFGAEIQEHKDAQDVPALGAFVVHQHLATRLHYDLRIECGGVLQSFAVPRGLTLDPSEKHLAVRTEPHPIEYLDFEDVIPAGNYGAGPMIVWDRGSVTPLGKPLGEQLETDKLDFVLAGRKVKGRFSLVKLKGEDKNYLLLKKADPHARPPGDVSVTELYPESIVSCLRADELAQKQDLGQAIVAKASKHGVKGQVHALPVFERESAKNARALWPWFDGVRVLVVRDGEHVTITTDAGEDVAGFYPEVVLSLLALAVPTFVFDGLLVIDGDDGGGQMPLLRRAEWLLSGDEHAALLALPATLYVRALLACGAQVFEAKDHACAATLLGDFVRGRGVVRVLPSFEVSAEAAVRSFCASQGLPGLLKGSLTQVAFLSANAAVSAPPPPAFAHAGRAVATTRATAAPVARTSNRTKVFWPELGLTKGDMLDYYAKVAPVMLPYLRDRPVLLTRYPDGIAGKSFFQWNVPPGLPDYLETYVVPGDPEKNHASRERRERRVFVIRDLASLTFVANLGSIAMHLLPFRRDREALCDYLVLDFDVKLSGLARAIPVVCTLHGILDAIGLPSFPKTSGQTGLHVMVPLGPGAPDAVARKLAELLGALLVKAHPADATMERVIAARGDKVYVDTGQTGTSRAIVAPYALRPTMEATVSTPLDWDEVGPELDPKAYSLRTVPDRLARLRGRDPMGMLLRTDVNLAQALEALSQLKGVKR